MPLFTSGRIHAEIVRADLSLQKLHEQQADLRNEIALNVKTALFFVAFIPQFVSSIAPAMGQFVLLGLVCVLLNTSVDVIVAVGASRLLASGGGRRSRHGRWLTMGSGCTLIGLGAYVALSAGKR